MEKGTVKEHTYNFTYRVNVEKYLIPFFKKAKLIDIKQADIQKYFNKVDNNGEFLAKSTLEKHKMILKSIFDKAIDNDYCYKNPVKDIKMPNTATVKIREVYSSDVAAQAEKYAKKHLAGLGIVIILNTGVRRSELLGLKWDDIDFEKNRIRIERAVTQTVGEVLIGEPKTETSKRIIPVSKDFLDYLETILRKSEYVIAGESNNPKTPNSYSVEFKKIMEQMELDIG
ncbi:MAG: tyrosine-type recombinase/integrase, partial [Epulopiscium sp.]|nr:tyrosine-type recombinase/integrase [Candidatus Epulonipiscium sp.]